MEYTVKALAELAGVTPRTLRWYDQKGLLKPRRTTEAGYRLYGPEEVNRLQAGKSWTRRALTVWRRCGATWRSWRPGGGGWTP